MCFLLLQSGGDAQPQCPRSYTPLSALSKMQPPGTHHGVPVGPVGSGDLSPGGRRHGCPSAFSAPPQVYGPHPPPHHLHRHGPIPEHPQPYIHGKYNQTFIFWLHLLHDGAKDQLHNIRTQFQTIPGAFNGLKQFRSSKLLTYVGRVCVNIILMLICIFCSFNSHFKPLNE